MSFRSILSSPKPKQARENQPSRLECMKATAQPTCGRVRLGQSARLKNFLFCVLMVAGIPGWANAQAEIIEVSCPQCGYGERFIQGATPDERARNVQNVIVVCERTRTVRNIKIPIDPRLPVQGEPLLARQYGMGRSDILGVQLPKFLIPGNTCPLFPITAYLEANVCPVHGGRGVYVAVVGHY